jgi:hypothetical protein
MFEVAVGDPPSSMSSFAVVAKPFWAAPILLEATISYGGISVVVLGCPPLLQDV